MTQLLLLLMVQHYTFTFRLSEFSEYDFSVSGSASSLQKIVGSLLSLSSATMVQRLFIKGCSLIGLNVYDMFVDVSEQRERQLRKRFVLRILCFNMTMENVLLKSPANNVLV
jgi:hypothetical protein